MKLAELAKLLELPDKHSDGHLVLSDRDVTWTLNFVQGQLLYAVDGLHAVRRWKRTLKQYFPNANWYVGKPQPSDSRSWQIHWLDHGLNQQQLSLIRAKLLIRTVIQECLFELSQCTHLSNDWQPTSFPISRTCRSIALSDWEVQMTFSKVKEMQQQWQDAGLAQLKPTLLPILKPETDAQFLPIDRQYLKGNFTLWDIAVQLDKPLVEITKSLLSFVQDKILEFQTLPDLPLSTLELSAPRPPTVKQPIQKVVAVKAVPPNPQRLPSEVGQRLIACIDDSPVLAHSLKKILVSAGYRALIIQEPMRGFSELIEHKPSLILLDLMLPNADGYSVCKFLRDTPVFAKTPIIILTGQSKPIDRAKARLAGATEFLVKPPQPDQLLQMIHQHLVG